ncbi:hypothetical protein FB645_003485 [Coemansia sp. IMI 203386]|nr:hypothetical protein FB645_003485 [Coemansia sp. IMI 203386]
MLNFVNPSHLGLAALGLGGYYACKRYIEACRIKVVTSEAKTSVVIRQTDEEGIVTLRDILFTKCLSLTDPEIAYMIPTVYLGTGILQTIYATMRVRLRDHTSDISYERELLTMEDGATVSLDWYPGIKPQSDGDEGKPIALVMSGVGGSSQEHHIRALVKSLAGSQQGFRIAVVNHRGTAKTPITSPRPYDSGFTEDFRTAVAHVRELNPNSKLVGIGFSMGANILTKYVGEEGTMCMLSCAVSVCCPFDISVSSAAMNESNLLNNYVFQPAVMSTLKRAIKRAQHLELDSSINIDQERVRNSKRLWELEDEFLVKIGGYKDLNEYYAKSSSVHFVDKIDVPYLAINSLDDRITPPHGIPMEKFSTNPNIALALVPHGGHLGFLTGFPPRIWFISPIIEFISAIV